MLKALKISARTLPHQRLSRIVRVLLAAIGTVLAAAAPALMCLLVVLFMRDPWWRQMLVRDRFLLGAVALLVALLFVASTVYGVELVRRALRGHSQRDLVRARPWYARHWYAIALVTTGFFAAAAIALAGGVTAFLMARSERLLYVYWFAFLGCLVLPIEVAIHELGHAAMGALVRFRFVTLRIGWLVIAKEGNRFKVSWDSTDTLEALGFHHGVPESLQALRARNALHAAGGPLATLAVALICRAAGAALEPARTPGQAMAAEMLSVGFWIAVLGLLNLLPIETRGGLWSDGALIWEALRPGASATRLGLRFALMWQQGRRPRDWRMSVASLLSAAKVASDNRSQEMMLLAALAVALDTGDRVRSEEILRQIQEMGPPEERVFHLDLELQGAMVEAFRGDVVLARQRFDRLASHPEDARYARLAEAVILSCEGRPAEARVALEEWHEMLATREGASRLRVGNEWAEDALRAKLT